MSTTPYDVFFSGREVDLCLPLFTIVELSEELNMPYHVLRDMTEEQYEIWADKFRLYWLDQYDNHRTPVSLGSGTLDQIQDKLKKFNNLDVNDPKIFIEDNENHIYMGYNNWSNEVNHWFPEMADVAISKGVKLDSELHSIIGFFRKKDTFINMTKRTIWKDSFREFKKDDTRPVWPGVKQAIRIGGGNQPVVNIRGAVVKHLYQTTMLRHLDKEELVIVDPSMGWAGRLVAFLAATNHPDLKDKKITYIGTDPNSQIYPRYKMIVDYWKKYVDPSCTAEVIPLCIGSEELHNNKIFDLYRERCTLVYTSPPYFSKERYSDEETQSWKKFGNYDTWRDGFLIPTIVTAYDLLADGGEFCWNISDLKLSPKKFLPLEADSVNAALRLGFTQGQTAMMLMRSILGANQTAEQIKNTVQFRDKMRKYEPMFRFVK